MKTHYGLALVLLLALAAAPAAAEGSVPTLPHEFYGTVTIGGSPAPVGTVITAIIGETEVDSIETTAAGEYGSSSRYGGTRLLVDATGDLVGETITFRVNGQAAQETATFTPGEVVRLDLSVAGESTPTATSTPGSGSSSSSGGGAQGSTPTAASTPSAPVTSVGKVSLTVSETGEVSETVTVRTGDGAGSVTIGEGTLARDENGDPLGEVTVASVEAAGIPQAPPGTTIGLALECEPAGATFDPPVTLTYTLSEDEWEQIGDTATLQVMWYNPGTGEWQEVAATVDPSTRTVTAQVSHFSIYALTWAAASPATEATTVPAAAAPGGEETPAGSGSQQPARETPWALIAAGVLVVAAVLAAGWYFRKKE
ncbi:MAG: hypothetical protein WC093_03255 [Methanoculleus sp.]